MNNQKKFGRKLALNKETIERLTQSDSTRVIGGKTFPNCPPTSPDVPCPCLHPITIPDTFLCTPLCIG